tara:strand:- start:32 stop:358 length:327 start_codon:yes stop_codon:yes gene_type:complete
MKNVMELLAKFEQLKTVSAESKEVVLSNGMTIGYKIEVSNHVLTSGSPFRAVVDVRRGDAWYTWGCDADEESREVVTWFAKRLIDIRNKDYDRREEERTALHDIIAKM